MTRRRREFPCKGPDNQVPKVFKSILSNMVCYEVAHELEMSLIENCRLKGFENGEIEVHKHIAEMNWKTWKKR
jgi:hypothetical protein